MALFDDPFEQRILLVDLEPFDVNLASVVTKRIASGPFMTASGDTPADSRYDNVIQSDGAFFSREMFIGNRRSGASFPDRGFIQMINAFVPDSLGSRFDVWLDTDNFTWQGRNITAYLLATDDVFSNKTQILKGKIKAIDFQENRIRFRTQSNAFLLDKNIQDNKYLGTGGAEGGSDLEGKSIPLSFGHIFNREAHLIDSANLVYQHHDGAIKADGITETRDSGVALTDSGTDHATYAALIAAAAPAAGQYDTADAVGLIRLGSVPAGTITMDLEGSDLGGTYSALPGDIIPFIAENFSNLTSGDIDTSSFTTLNTDVPYDIGYATDLEEVNIQRAFDEVVNSYRGFYGFNRAGELDVGVLGIPAVSEDLAIGEVDIDNGSITRKDPQPVFYRTNFNFKKNWHPQSGDDLAAGVSAANKLLFSNEWTTDSQEDLSVQTKFPEAKEGNFFSLIFDTADAVSENADTLTYNKERRDSYTMQTNLRPLDVELNQTIKVTHTRFGLSGGKNFSIIRFKEPYLDARVNITIVG